MKRLFRSRVQRVAVVALSLVALLAGVLLPEKQNSAHAIDLVSLANCALPAQLQLSARIGDAPSTHAIFVGNDFTTGCAVTAPEPFIASIN